MLLYLSFRQINDKIAELRARNGEDPALSEALLELYRQHQYIEHASNLGLIAYLGNSDDAALYAASQDLYIEWNSKVMEYLAAHPGENRGSAEVQALSDRNADVFLHFLFPHTKRSMEPLRSLFEINYIYAGTYRFTYEEKEYLLQPGDLCIVAPPARHLLQEAEETVLTADAIGPAGSIRTGGTHAGPAGSMCADGNRTPGTGPLENTEDHDGFICANASSTGPDGSMCADGSGTPGAVSGNSGACDGEMKHFLIQQYMSSATFHSTFIALLSDDNIISNFFKDLLTNPKQANFLLLSTGRSENFPYIQRLAKDMFLEQFKYDHYSPECSNNLLKLFFANVLRSYHSSYQFYSGRMNVDFVPVLNYLAKNYRTTSLNELAEVFHYSPSHLSTCIKQITGTTYTEMVRDLKMNDAVDYLIHSDKSVEEISLMLGYRSADPFSRAFRQRYGISPSQYRKQHKDA